MFKRIYHVSSWILFISALLIVSCLAFRCIHDEIDEINEQKTRSTRSTSYLDYKARRDSNPESFEPLVIHFYVDGIDKEISSNAFHNIRLAFDEVKAFINQTFKVKRRKRPYRIERNDCSSTWKSGLNIGKCSAFKNGSEMCDSKAITYKIPNRYLGKLEVYDFEGSHPKHTKPAGPGLNEANFIAFVTFRREKFCEQDVVAYGSYCRLNKKTNEPLSGILNFCPQAFIGTTVNYRYYYNVILHELLHTLGFTLELFHKIPYCDRGFYCPKPKNFVQEDHSKNYRLMFPLVVKHMQDHFGCTEPWFGAPMAPKETANATDKAAYTAHWHPVLMYSSIMTPDIDDSSEMLVDNMTLALFESTGWYQVNYSQAENFKFGAGEGCNFGLNKTCGGRFLCNPSEHSYGCDMLHESVGKCTNISVHHPCGVYMPDELNCERSISKHLDVDFSFLGFKHKCFLQELPDSKTEPMCLPVQCKSASSYDILINSTWLPCYKTEKVSNKNITILCPDGILFCPDKKQMNPSTAACPAHLYFFVAVRMYFEQPTFDQLVASYNFKNFKVTTIKQIAIMIGIPENYIANATLSVFKQIYLDFAICPPPDLNAKELNSILKRAQNFLDGNFVFHLKGTTDQFISSNDIKIDPVERISFSDVDGFRSLIVFPVVCAIFLIASFIASVVRLILLQKHRPRRANEAIDENDDIQLSGVKPL